MAVTATSGFAKACQGAIDILARSSTFQNRVSTYHSGTAATVAGALNHIYGYECFLRDSVSLADLRPYALVIDDESVFDRIGQCQQHQMDLSVGVLVVISDKARLTDVHGESPTDDWNDSWLDFLNFSGGVMDDAAAVFGGDYDAGASFYWPFHTIETVSASVRTPVKSRNPGDDGSDYWEAIFSWQYGEAD